MANLNKVNEEKMEEILDEILQENISVETFQEVAARSLETAEYDKVNQLLLQHYNKKVGYNANSSNVFGFGFNMCGFSLLIFSSSRYIL